MKTLFILSLFKQGYKIKVSTLYHLLKGKRTVSVLMNGFLFDNFSYFHLFPTLKEESFYHLLQELTEQGFLVWEKETMEAEITDAGRQHLLEQGAVVIPYINHLDGYKYAKTEEEMWRMLQFLVQVASNLSYQNKQYIPLEASPRYQLKMKALVSEINKQAIGLSMRKEWQSVLEVLSDGEADFIAQQFSGYQINGKAEQQLLSDADSFKRTMYRKNTYHHLFRCIEALPQTAILQRAIKEELEKNKNQSMLQTKELWQSGYSLTEIAQMRQMKPSTVNDHFLEMVMSEEIERLEDFLPEESRKQLQQLTSPCQSWRYAELRQQFELDYFSFRLYQIVQIKKERGKYYGA